MKKSLLFFCLVTSIIAGAQTDSLGRLRYKGEGVEAYVRTGVTSYAWARLNNSVNFFTTPPRLNGTERNTWVTLGSYTVKDTGVYMVVMEASGFNAATYSGRDTARQDLVGYFRLTRSPEDYPIIYEPFNIKISDGDHLGGRFYFLSIPAKGFYMNYLAGGTLLKLQIMVPNDNRARTTGPNTWTASNGKVHLIRLQ